MAIAKRIELLLIDPNSSFSEAEDRITAGLDSFEWRYDLVVRKKELETIDFIWDEERPYNLQRSTYEDALTAVRKDRKPEPGRPGKICGYDLEDLILFATACRECEITEDNMHKFADSARMAMAFGTEAIHQYYMDAGLAMMKEDKNENKNNRD